jgi:nucleoid-associated protein YgaU
MDNGIVEEVSVGMSFKQLLCSACGDDLLSDMGKVWDRTCANGHVIGMGDHHVKPNGLGVFSELSAVSKGASQGAKILGMQKRNLAASLERSDLALAASVKADPELMLFTPHANLDITNEGEDPVLIAELQAKLDAAEAEKAALAAAKTEAETKLATAEAAKVALTAAKDAAEAAKVALTAAKDAAEAELATIKTELEAATTDKTEAESKLVAAQNELQSLKDAESARLSVRPFKIPLGGIQGLNATHTDVAAKSKPVVAGPSPAFKTPK